MAQFDQARYREATAVFKLGVKASGAAVHRTLSREPKGKGWVQCKNSPVGITCKPDKVRAAIEFFKQAYEIFPDIVAVNQIALAYEMIGEFETARRYFLLMHEQAGREANAAYLQAAAMGLERAR